jgi:hypothetical protein
MIRFLKPVKPDTFAPLTVRVELNVDAPVTVPPVKGSAFEIDVRV